MKREACVYEQEVTRGVASNQLNESMRAHLATCDVCQEAVRVASWMRGLAKATEEESALPSAGFIRWRSQLLEKQEVARRATRPITIVQTVSSVTSYSPSLFCYSGSRPSSNRGFLPCFVRCGQICSRQAASFIYSCWSPRYAFPCSVWQSSLLSTQL